MPDSGVVATRVRTVTAHLCVSRSYLERRGTLESLDELVEHDTVDMLVNGAGIGVLSAYCCRPALASGQLVPLFPEWSIPSLDVNLVFASKRELSPNVRAFVDFMKERLGASKHDDPREA